MANSNVDFLGSENGGVDLNALKITAKGEVMTAFLKKNVLMPLTTVKGINTFFKNAVITSPFAVIFRAFKSTPPFSEPKKSTFEFAIL